MWPHAVDPDRSNPTRSRWERPLDTIRSFEAAIDGGYRDRRSIIFPGTTVHLLGTEMGRLANHGVITDSEQAGSRRTSYYGGSMISPASGAADNAHIMSTDGGGGRFNHGSYYGSRPASMMYSNRYDGSQQDLRVGGMGQRDNYYDQQQWYGSYGPPPQGARRGWPPQSGPGYRVQHPNEYPIPSNHRSYETVTSASGSGSLGEAAGYQTDPTSSDNSSVERVQAGPKRQAEPVNDYGIGFSQSQSYQPPAFTLGVQGAGMNGGALNQGMGPPQVPQKDQGSMLRKPISAASAQQRPAAPEKRKSWFARRFSRQG